MFQVGYSVDEKYYLTNASTHAGDTSFPSTSGGTETGHSGNGYARITVSSTETIQATRWINIEEQKERETYTGAFNYGTYSIEETDSNGTVITHNGEN